LSTGGTGKTPHAEYIIRLLKDKYKLATLSRGYKRKLKGYALATELSLVEDIGDESKQFKQKFSDVEVCVSENRVKGVYQLLQDEPEVRAIIMDDGLQHRRIKPGMQILLTSFTNLFCNDLILPAGNLREPKSGYKRMHIIIVTKCPITLKQYTADGITKKIKPKEHQKIFFTTEQYEEIKPLFSDQKINFFNRFEAALLVSGIAKNDSFIKYLQTLFKHVDVMRFPDHHYFTEQDINEIKKAGEKIIITTEKDAMRLMEQKEFILQNEIPFFVLPMKISFMLNQSNGFHKVVEEYVASTLADFDIV
ncbi:MAG: tetraacyldisaccharide 4'-kinase, partial [Fimbriimonadaceae bacterium]|nr:tetraacyldisaccharide 4'-kinase [Chitinophagales bacterium]